MYSQSRDFDRVSRVLSVKASKPCVPRRSLVVRDTHTFPFHFGRKYCYWWACSWKSSERTLTCESSQHYASPDSSITSNRISAMEPGTVLDAVYSLCFDRELAPHLRRLSLEERQELLVASGTITQIYVSYGIPSTRDAVGRAFTRYRPAGVANGCYDLFSLNESRSIHLPTHLVAVMLPFCESDSNTKLLVRRGVHVAIGQRIWLMTGDNSQALQADTIVQYIYLLLQW